MKRQQIRNEIIQVMAETVFGSTERNDDLARARAKYHITAERLRVICLGGGGKTNYWVH